MSEQNPNSNIYQFEDAQKRKERQAIVKETYETEQITLDFLKNEIELLPSFIKANQTILDAPNTTIDDRIDLRMYLYNLVENIFDVKDPVLASNQVEFVQEQFLETERNQAVHDALTEINELAASYLKHLRAGYVEHQASVSNMDGDDLNMEERDGITKEEALRNRVEIIFTNVKKWHDATKAAKEELKDEFTMDMSLEARDVGFEFMEQIEALEIEMNIDSPDLPEELQGEMRSASDQIKGILELVTN